MFFPESFWPCYDREYIKLVEFGKIRCNVHKILFLGLTKENGKTLISNVHLLLDNLPRAKVIAYENDTFNVAANECSKYSDRFTYVYEELGHAKLEQDKSKFRTDRMSLYRNNLLNEGKKENLDEYDYVGIVDLDLLGGYSIEGIYHTMGVVPELEKRGGKPMVGSNGIFYKDNIRMYYDTWALRDKKWEDSEKEDLQKNMFTFNRGDSLIKLLSCFGGLCIYPISILSTTAEYQGGDCEHVYFHKRLHELGYDMYLNPSQITLYSENYYRS